MSMAGKQRGGHSPTAQAHADAYERRKARRERKEAAERHRRAREMMRQSPPPANAGETPT